MLKMKTWLWYVVFDRHKFTSKGFDTKAEACGEYVKLRILGKNRSELTIEPRLVDDCRDNGKYWRY